MLVWRLDLVSRRSRPLIIILCTLCLLVRLTPMKFPFSSAAISTASHTQKTNGLLHTTVCKLHPLVPFWPMYSDLNQSPTSAYPRISVFSTFQWPFVADARLYAPSVPRVFFSFIRSPTARCIVRCPERLFFNIMDRTFSSNLGYYLCLVPISSLLIVICLSTTPSAAVPVWLLHILISAIFTSPQWPPISIGTA